jgi:general secretion pathway protein N
MQVGMIWRRWIEILAALCSAWRDSFELACVLAARFVMRPPWIAEVLCVLSVSALGAAAAEQQATSSSALSNPLAAQSLDELSTTLDRPLFSPSRRPPAPPPAPAVQTAAPPPPPPSPPNLVLVGVVLDGESARAIVRNGTDKKIQRTQIGDDIDGWKVSQIDRRKVVLSLDGRFATFTLFSSDREKSEAPALPMSGGEAKTPKQQGELQQATAQAAAPPSGQPVRQRRPR